jgi:hypothetical protein
MKIIIITVCALALITAVVLQAGTIKQPVIAQAPKKADNIVKFLQPQHDFGKIKLGIPVSYDFIFKNTCSKPVIIEYAKASCGCTTPNWPKAPVTTAKQGKITAGFNAAIAGTFYKTIYVKVAGYSELLSLHITGKVVNADEYAKYKAATAGK